MKDRSSSTEGSRYHRSAVAAAHGISIIFQELNLVDQLSIAENIFAGRLEGLKRVNWKEINRKAKELLDRIGFDADPQDRRSGP